MSRTKKKKKASKKKVSKASKKKKVSAAKRLKRPMAPVRRKACGRRYKETVKEKAVERYKGGTPLTEICRLKSMPNNTKVVRRWLVLRGVEIRSEKVLIYPRKKILKQLKAKRPRSEIIAEYGCSTKFLSNLANGKISP